MTSTDEAPPAQSAFAATERVYIANLQPEAQSHGSGAYIDAQIALVWPYSSSTRQFAFLLSETDVRPLKLSRQVKVTLYNGAARAVQTAKVGIGDRIKLPLHGCRWQASEDTTATPGKRIKWDITYRKAISLEVKPSASEQHTRVVQYESTGTPSPRHSIVTNGTAPSPIREARFESPELPATARTPFSFRTSGVHSHGATPNDPFLEDIEQESGRKRKRTKFARPSGAWKLLDDDQLESPALPSSPLAPQGTERENGLVRDEFDLQDNGAEITPEPVAAQHGIPQADEVLSPKEPDLVPLEEDLNDVPLRHAEQVRGTDVETVQDVDQSENSEIEIVQDDDRAEHAEPGIVKPMGPPMPPLRPTQGMRLQLPTENAFDLDERATTPRLNPLASPGLPLISPLIKRSGVETGYFSSAVAGSSELDASAVSNAPNTVTTVTADAPSVVDAGAELPEAQVMEMTITEGVVVPDTLDARDQEGDPKANASEPVVIDLEESSTEEEAEESEVEKVVEEEACVAKEDLVDDDTHIEEEEHVAEKRPIEEGVVEVEELAEEEDDDSDRDAAADKHAALVREAAADVVTSVSRPQDAMTSPLLSSTEVDAAQLEQKAPKLPDSGFLEYDLPKSDDRILEVVEEPEPRKEVTSSPGAQPPAIEHTTVDQETEGTTVMMEITARHPQPGSSLHVVDGAAESQETEIPEYVRLLQGGFEHPGPAMPNIVTSSAPSCPDAITQKPPSVADEEIPFVELQPVAVVGNMGQSSTSLPGQPPRVPELQLPTPDLTQEQPEINIISQPMERSAEPLTPQDTQQDAEDIGLEPVASVVEKTPSPPPAVNEAMVSEIKSPESRRVSQRLSRKSDSFKAIESPFFSSRKAAEAATEQPQPLPNLDLPATRPRRTRQSKTPEPVLPDVGISSSKGKQVARQTGTTTSLAYYPPFNQLQDYFGQTADFIAICAEASTQPIKAKAGPRDWHSSLSLVDPETPDVTVTAQAFRPYKDALPSANVGDIVILRSFKVQTAKHNWQLLSTDASAWAVFRSDPDSRAMFGKIDMTGPQLEYGRGETTRVKELVRWWSDQSSAETGPEKEISQDKEPQVIAHGDNDGDAAVVQSVEQPSSPRRSRRKQLPTEIHEEPAAEPTAQKSVTPQPTRHQPPRRARTKTPIPPQPQPPAGPSSSPHAAASPLSPRHTRRRTRSTLSPAASLAEAAPTSVASSLAATSPIEHSFPTPSAKAPSSKKGKGRIKPQVQSADTSQDTAQQLADEAQSAQEQGEHTEETESNRRSTRRHKRHTSGARAGSPPLVHELRDGMRYVDEPEGEAGQGGNQRTRVTRSQVHELRDGVRYVDD